MRVLAILYRPFQLVFSSPPPYEDPPIEVIEYVYPRGWDRKRNGYYPTQEILDEEEALRVEYALTGFKDEPWKLELLRPPWPERDPGPPSPFATPFDNSEFDEPVDYVPRAPREIPIEAWVILGLFGMYVFSHIVGWFERREARRLKRIAIRLDHGIPEDDDREWDEAMKDVVLRRHDAENLERMQGGLPPLWDDENGRTHVLKEWDERGRPLPPKPTPRQVAKAKYKKSWREERKRVLTKKRERGEAFEHPGCYPLSDDEKFDDEVYVPPVKIIYPPPPPVEVVEVVPERSKVVPGTSQRHRLPDPKWVIPPPPPTLPGPGGMSRRINWTCKCSRIVAEAQKLQQQREQEELQRRRRMGYGPPKPPPQPEWVLPPPHLRRPIILPRRPPESLDERQRREWNQYNTALAKALGIEPAPYPVTEVPEQVAGPSGDDLMDVDVKRGVKRARDELESDTGPSERRKRSKGETSGDRDLTNSNESPVTGKTTPLTSTTTTTITIRMRRVGVNSVPVDVNGLFSDAPPCEGRKVGEEWFGTVWRMRVGDDGRRERLCNFVAQKKEESSGMKKQRYLAQLWFNDEDLVRAIVQKELKSGEYFPVAVGAAQPDKPADERLLQSGAMALKVAKKPPPLPPKVIKEHEERLVNTQMRASDPRFRPYHLRPKARFRSLVTEEDDLQLTVAPIIPPKAPASSPKQEPEGASRSEPPTSKVGNTVNCIPPSKAAEPAPTPPVQRVSPAPAVIQTPVMLPTRSQPTVLHTTPSLQHTPARSQQTPSRNAGATSTASASPPPISQSSSNESVASDSSFTRPAATLAAIGNNLLASVTSQPPTQSFPTFQPAPSPSVLPAHRDQPALVPIQSIRSQPALVPIQPNQSRPAIVPSMSQSLPGPQSKPAARPSNFSASFGHASVQSPQKPLQQARQHVPQQALYPPFKPPAASFMPPPPLPPPSQPPLRHAHFNVAQQPTQAALAPPPRSSNQAANSGSEFSFSFSLPNGPIYPGRANGMAAIPVWPGNTGQSLPPTQNTSSVQFPPAPRSQETDAMDVDMMDATPTGPAITIPTPQTGSLTPGYSGFQRNPPLNVPNFTVAISSGPMFGPSLLGGEANLDGRKFSRRGRVLKQGTVNPDGITISPTANVPTAPQMSPLFNAQVNQENIVTAVTAAAAAAAAAAQNAAASSFVATGLHQLAPTGPMLAQQQQPPQLQHPQPMHPFPSFRYMGQGSGGF